ncbi:MAG TPA: hypothetical protein VFO55_13960 [Gemmatimonadaceae bacterium]|nr:hypothetical protein [Gemmatimonadaceae bacterium]
MNRFAFGLLCVASAAAAQPSNPEIYLLPLTVRGANISVGPAVNITNRPGYDNQPSFTFDGRELYFTSTRADSQADIYKYNIEAKSTERITHTAPESEYSATQLPYPKNFSVIRVEKDSTQRLWMLSPDGRDGRPVFADIKPVGYHTWLDPYHLALFVLGTPNALVLADTRTGRGDTLARDIGRSLVALPDGGGFSFLSRHGQDWVLTVVRLNRSGRVVYIQPLVTMPRGMDYIAWIGGTVLGGTGSKLMAWTPGGAWREVADLAPQGITRISRIAVSRDRRRLALVAEPATPSGLEHGEIRR